VEAAKVLRQRGYENLIIGLSGNVMDDDIQQFLQAGANAFMAKPLTSEQLDQIISYIKENGCRSVIERSGSSGVQEDNKAIVNDSITLYNNSIRLHFADGRLSTKSL